jgi:hypothetical protein
MNSETPSAQHSAGKGLKGLLLSPHISGAMNAGVPMVVLSRDSGDACQERAHSTSVSCRNSVQSYKHEANGVVLLKHMQLWRSTVATAADAGKAAHHAARYSPALLRFQNR